MKLVILGAGGYGNTIKDIAEQIGYEIIGVLDDSDLENPLDSFSKYIAEDVRFIPAFGNNELRLLWFNRIQQVGGKFATLIHPTAYVSPKALIAPGTVILPHTSINTDVVIQRGCIINIGAIIDHGCVLEEGVHVCLGAIIKSDNKVKALTKIEAGEVIEARKWPIITVNKERE